MKDNNNAKKSSKKSFFARLFDKLDKKIEEKAKNSKSCCNNSKPGDKSCCS